jgi:threonine/homoserine/homoserine lactone efflux protein
MSILLSMGGFALATSISPGPVNLVVLSGSIQHGFKAAMRYVAGATVGFTILLLLTGLGIRELLACLPQLISLVRWAGVAFLLYMAYKLAFSSGQLSTEKTSNPPSLLSGAAMQWLNPKAWLASLAGMGAFAGNDISLVGQFTVLYFFICYASLSCWAFVGVYLRKYVNNAKRVRIFNRSVSLVVLLSAIYLIQE